MDSFFYFSLNNLKNFPYSNNFVKTSFRFDDFGSIRNFLRSLSGRLRGVYYTRL